MIAGCELHFLLPIIFSFDSSLSLQVILIKQEYGFDLSQSCLQVVLPFEQLFDVGVLPLNLVSKHFDDVVFAVKHISKVSCHGGEAIVSVGLRLHLLNGHPALIANVSTLALSLLVVDDVHPHHLFLAVDARHVHVWADSFMLLNYFPYTFGMAPLVSLTLDGLEFAFLFVGRHFKVLEDSGAAHGMVLALELHLYELFLHFFLNTEEFRFLTLHRTHFCLHEEFFEALVMEPIFARLALHRIH